MRPNEPETGGGVDAFRTTGSRMLERIRDRRGGLLFGLAAGGFAAAVIGFMMVTNPDLEPLLPRIGSAFSVSVGEYGEPYVVVDPNALDQEAGGSTDPAEAQESGTDAGTPALLFPIDGLGSQSSGGGNGSGGTDQDPSTDPEAPPPAGNDQEPAPDEDPTPEPEPSPSSSPSPSAPPSTDPSPDPTDPSPTPEPSPEPSPTPEPTKPPKEPKEPKPSPSPEPSPPPEP